MIQPVKPELGQTTQYKRVLSTDPMSLPQRTKRRRNRRWSGHMGVTDARLTPISNEQSARLLSPHLASILGG